MNWFALSVRMRQEQNVGALLSSKAYEVFVPTYATGRKWSDRIKIVHQPLFPGYVFCRFDLADRVAPVITTPGVLQILGAGSTPHPVDEAEMEAIQRVVDSKLAAGPYPYLQEGTHVQVRKGPLAGIEGLVVSLKSPVQLIVSVTLLNRSLTVEVDPEWLQVIGDRSRAAHL